MNITHHSNDWWTFPLAMMSFFGIILGLLIWFVIWSASATCEAKWENSGMKAEWQFFSGCRVQRKDGTWVPSSAIRDLSQ